MIINNVQQTSLREILQDLWDMERIDIAYDGNPNYVESREQLLKLLTDNVEQANNMIDTLNFDNLIDSHILNFVPDIVRNFRTIEEQETFVTHLSSLQERFPNVNFSPAIFYAELSYNI